MLVAGLSTGHMIGLAVTGGVFIAFALASSFLAPRRWPDFPGKNGLSVFIIVSFVLFFAMLTAVEVFGVEKSEAAAESSGKTIDVTESEYKIALPSLTSLAAGTYTFVVKNAGQTAHNLVVGTKSTPLIQPGQTAELTVALASGTTPLFCSVDGHRKLGMNATLTVA